MGAGVAARVGRGAEDEGHGGHHHMIMRPRRCQISVIRSLDSENLQVKVAESGGSADAPSGTVVGKNE